MVNVTKTPFGGYAYVIGGGAGNYTGYGPGAFHVAGSSPDSYHPRQQLHSDVQVGERSTYRARQLQTTNLETEYKKLPKLTSLPYLARGMIHQGQLRSKRSHVYNFPCLKTESPSRSTSSRSGRTQSRSKSRQRSVPDSKTKKKPFVLPDIAKRTAGISTIDTLCHPGFAKGFAASRADSGSLVNALRGANHPFVHSYLKTDGYVGSIPDSDESVTLVPHGYNDFYYTALDALKRKRLDQAYIGTFEEHKRNREKIVKQRIMRADKVKRDNLYADQLTATLLGLRRTEPIRIPTAQMDYDNDSGEYDSGRTKTLKAVEQARKNIAGSYLNVWNLKIRQNKSEEE